MGGFFNLIEAFLAFTLTMLALSTAVSSILGTLIGLFRVRARVLRALVENFYRNELHPLIDRARDKSGWHPTSAALAELWNQPASYRKTFVAEMTLLPKVLSDDELRDTTDKIGEAKALSALGVIERWRALGHSLDALPRETFESRLEITRVGELIEDYYQPGEGDDQAALERRATVVGEPTAVAAVARLTDRFEALGATSSELFARGLKPWSILAGFVLAFSLNVDSFNLLNSYMRDPQVTAALIGAYDQNRADAAPAARSEDTAELESQVAKLDDLVASLPTGPAKQTAEEALATVREIANESDQATHQIEQAILPLTESFPIGWNRFPNCGPGAADPRCQAEHGRGTLLTWLIGVVVTGFLVGLGTPFWVRLVNQVLRARSVTQRARAMAQRMVDQKQAEVGAAPQVGPPGASAAG